MQKWYKQHVDVWFNARLRVQTKDVRLALIDLSSLADGTGLVDLSLEEVAGIMGLGQKTALDAVETLERLGLLRIERQGVEPRWRRAWVTTIESDLRYTESGRRGGTKNYATRFGPKEPPVPPPKPVPKSPAQSTARLGRPVDPERLPLPPSLNYPDVRRALVDYLTTRPKGPWDEALSLVRLRTLEKWGRARAVAALEHSAGYQGLFEPDGRMGRPGTNNGADIGRQILGDMQGDPDAEP